MATEKPSDPNTGGTGIDSRSEVFAPSFVGGQTDPTKGIIAPSNANNAASAPPKSAAPTLSPPPPPPPPAPTSSLPTVTPQPQQSTTQLGSVGNATAQPASTQKVGAGDIAKGFAPTLGLVAGEVIGNPGVATTLLGNTFGGTVNSFTQPALSSATSAISGELPAAVASGTGGEAAAAGEIAAGAGAASGAISSILSAAIPGVATFIGGKIAGESTGTAAASGVGATIGAGLGSLLDPVIGPLGTIAGGAIGSFIGQNYKTVERSIGSFFKHLFG